MVRQEVKVGVEVADKDYRLLINSNGSTFPKRRSLLIRLLRQMVKKFESIKDDYLAWRCKWMIKHFYIIKKESRFTQELYLQIALHFVTGKFDGFIIDPNQENQFGKALAKHNLEIACEFMLHRISLANWFNFSEVVERSANRFEKISCKDAKEWWDQLMADCDNLLCAVENTPIAGAIRKDVIAIQNNKSRIISGNYFPEDTGMIQAFPKYFSSLDHCVGKGIALPENCSDLIKDVWEKISRFIRKPKRKKFSVWLWERTQRDLFQGNFSQCCVSIGLKNHYPIVKLPGVRYKKYPAGVLNYITDLGIQVANVIDENKQIFIGQCWLFVSLDDDGKPVLVADSFDLKSEYAESKSYTSAIRDCMFDFLGRYADATGIRKVVLGCSGPILKSGNAHRIRNDVKVSDLKKIGFRNGIKKLGGYFKDRKYFLESCGGDSAYLVYEKNGELEIPKSMTSFQVVSKLPK